MAALLDGVAKSEERFGCRQNEEHGVGVIDVEHEAAMRPRRIHWGMERSSRVRSQYAKNTATTKAEWAWDQEGLKYI